MADEADFDNDKHNRTRSASKAAPTAGVENANLSAESTATISPSALLGDPRLSGRGNGATNVAVMHQAQQLYGNRAVQRQLQRSAGGNVAVQRDPPASTSAPPTSTPAPAAGVTPAAGPAPPVNSSVPADLQAFRTHGAYPADANGQTVAPSTGMGGFNARYDPASMALAVTVNIAMTFSDGMAITGNTVSANDPSLAAAATAINKALSKLPPGPRLTAALAKVQSDWQWTGAADPKITTFMSDYRNQVTSAWSSSGSGIVFQSSHPGWDTQLANVHVAVNTSSTAAASAGGGAAPAGPTPIHTQATIFKTADDNTDFGANVGPGSATSGTDQTLELGSSQVSTQTHLLHQEVRFGNDTATLSPRAQRFLNKFITTFQAPAGGAGTTLDITGHASTTGSDAPEGDAHNAELSQKRAQAVADYLRNTTVGRQTLRNVTTRIRTTTGVGSAGATGDKEWRRVDIDVAGGQGQNVAAHEFGHMIGLDDEYSTGANSLIKGSGNPVGTATEHNKLSTDQGMPGSVAENNENIMSLGSTIKPQHYSTFMEALRTVTSSTEWRVK